MVRKSSFLDKLFGKRKDVSQLEESKADVGVLLDKHGRPTHKHGRNVDVGPVANPPTAAAPGVDRTKPANGGSGGGVPPEVQPVTMHLGKREATNALVDGFQDLSALLRGLDRRMEQQGQRTGDLNEKFTELPAMARAQVDFMSQVSRQLSDQKQRTGELLSKLTGLPALFEGIHKTLERQAATEERTEKNLTDFRQTMDRIHESIGTLAKGNQKAIKDTTESFERSSTRTTRAFEETQKQAYTSFEKTQSAQLGQLGQMIESSTRVNRWMIVTMVIVAFTLVALLATLVSR